MDIDPIVLMAYVSVAINIITMIAACLAYAIFHVRKRRRRGGTSIAAGTPEGPVEPVFLQRCSVPAALAADPGARPLLPLALAQGSTPSLAEVR